MRLFEKGRAGDFFVALKSRAEGYCYGFQGQEADDELFGPDDAIAFTYRMVAFPEPGTQSGRTVNEEAKVDTIDIFDVQRARTGPGTCSGPFIDVFDITDYDTSILNKGERRSVRH